MINNNETYFKNIQHFRLAAYHVTGKLEWPWNAEFRRHIGLVTAPGPNPLADLDPPPTKLGENIILNVLVKMDNTLRSSAY